MRKNKFRTQVCNAAALHLRPIIKQWLPHGQKVGFEEYHVMLTSARNVRSGMLIININTGAWRNTTTGSRGADMVSLTACVHGLSETIALKKLAGLLLEGMSNGRW
jgi:hypothetical protein